jgi:hypothetical protein
VASLERVTAEQTGDHRGRSSRRWGKRRAALTVSFFAVPGVAFGALLVPRLFPPTPLPPADGVVAIATDRPLRSFDGSNALGAGIDGLEKGEIDRVWTPSNIEAMRSAGFGPLSYRLRTELGVKAWHWNPSGTWSDSENEQGYWVSSSEPQDDPGVSYGYHLPRRGNTIDQANNDGYSRLDDGDRATFWKSNPYLDSHFTGERDDIDPQWIMVAFPQPVPVDTLQIDWGTPHATQFRVQYWSGLDAHFPVEEGADWRDFPTATHTGKGGRQAVRVAAGPRDVQYLRILLIKDSNTAPAGSRDIRDRLGYAVRELSVGHQGPAGFVDHVRHRASKHQTTMFTSSTDPWHRASDIDEDYEHASFERVFASGLTSGKPMMVPVPVLYGVPEDGAALIRYLRKRNFPVRQVEMGEEPDGQLAQPEHYAALYLQVARQMKVVDPSLEFGGPGYQTTLPDWVHWPNSAGERSWTGRFVTFLRQREALEDFDFFSFEWYPYDDVCADPAEPLVKHPELLAELIRRQEAAGLPPDVPKVITEYGYSAFAGQVEVELPGAMVNAEIAALFLRLGGDTSYFYGLEPNWVFQEKEGEKCDTRGNLMLLQFYDEWKIRPVAAYYVARMVTHRWVQPGSGRHTLYPADSTVRNDRGQQLVTAYAVRRPDGRLGVLLLNKDPQRTLTVRLVESAKGNTTPLEGPLRLDQYSSEQYDWHPGGAHGNGGHPDPNDPPAHTTLDEDAGATVTLPPYSVTVVQAPQ